MPIPVRSRLTYSNVMATAAIFLALGGGAYALTGVPDKNGVFHGCVSSRTGLLRVVRSPSSCHRAKRRGSRRVPGESAVEWSQRGPAGAKGSDGANGANGISGTNGTNGATKVTVRDATGPLVKEGATSVAAAPCNPGEHLTGGGVSATDTNFEVVERSFPNAGEWVAEVRNTAKGAPTLEVAAVAYAMCASP